MNRQFIRPYYVDIDTTPFTVNKAGTVPVLHALVLTSSPAPAPAAPAPSSSSSSFCLQTAPRCSDKQRFRIPQTPNNNRVECVSGLVLSPSPPPNIFVFIYTMCMYINISHLIVN